MPPAIPAAWCARSRSRRRRPRRDENVGHRGVKHFRPPSLERRSTRAFPPHRGRTPSFATLAGAPVSIRSSVAVGSVDLARPARAVMGSRVGRRRPEHASAERGHAQPENRAKARSIGPLDGCSDPHRCPVAGGVARSGRDEAGVVCTAGASSGWPSAAMVPILRKSVGGGKPQYPVRKSTRFCRRDVWLVLAVLAGEESA